jgi:hypothetical protein
MGFPDIRPYPGRHRVFADEGELPEGALLFARLATQPTPTEKPGLGTVERTGAYLYAGVVSIDDLVSLRVPEHVDHAAMLAEVLRRKEVQPCLLVALGQRKSAWHGERWDVGQSESG